MRPTLSLLLALTAAAAAPTLHAAPNGKELYQQNCSMCHGVEGLGMTTVFPPLAKSDFIVNNREKALRGPMEGLSGAITVNGTHFEGGMPPAFLDDEQLTAVFNHVFSSWGNDVKPVTVEEIAKIRATTKYPTLAALTASMVGDKLPTPPAGWNLKVGAELTFGPTRLALHPDGEHVLILSMKADVWIWKPGTAETSLLFKSEDILDKDLGDPLVMGLTIDSKNRLYITSNQCNKKTSPVSNEMTIFRTEPWKEGQPWTAPKPWYHVQNPFGIGPYNHGLSNIAQGPDGLLYVNSGARTDSGEAGKQPNYATTGEEPNTSAMWQMDPEAATPTVTIFAKGLRNNYGFCWDDEKRMIATENGPDAHAPEELNQVEQGHHYGFPYQYSDWTNKPYPHTPDIPAGLKITLPFRNLGPDGGGTEKGISTFEPHSCPTGIVWLDEKWPAPFAGTFITTRFGNMLKLDGGDVGFDVLQLKLNFADKTLHTTKLLAPLGRPIDVLKLPGHRLVIAEHSRATTMEGGTGTPGRLLLLEPK